MPAKSQAKPTEVHHVANATRVTKVTKSKKADLEFPVSRIGTNLRRGHYFGRYSDATPVFLSAVLEFLTGEVLDLAGIQAKNEGRKRIVPTNIFSGIQQDAGLVDLFSNIVISEGGCVQHVHEAMLEFQKKPKSRSTSQSQSQADTQHHATKDVKAKGVKAKESSGKSKTKSKSKDVKDVKDAKPKKDGKKSTSKADGKKSGSKSQSKSKVRGKSQKTSQAV